MLDLVQLRSFVMVAQTRSFTLSAERLGLGQSTVSQHLQRLERGLGRRLIDRDTHAVRLTADGEALLPHARQLLALERQDPRSSTRSRRAAPSASASRKIS